MPEREEPIDDQDWFWSSGRGVSLADPATCVVVDGEHYLIGDGKQSGKFSGFGGRRHVIEFFDGRTVTTTDLWHQGTIPPKWREQHPDNARFVPAEQSSPSSEGEGLPSLDQSAPDSTRGVAYGVGEIAITEPPPELAELRRTLRERRAAYIAEQSSPRGSDA